MELVFLGTNNFGWEIYEWLCDRDGVDVKALLTEESQLPLIETIEPDIVVVSGFGVIVDPEFLQIPEYGFLNVHPGYLPHTRGYNPNVWSIVQDFPAGVSIHYMQEDIDAGDILARRKVDKPCSDDAKNLYTRIESAAVNLFVETWPDIEDDAIEPVCQDDARATYRYKQDFIDLCEIDPKQVYNAKSFVDILRALTFPPFDNAYVVVDRKRNYLEFEVRETGSTVQPSEGFIEGY